MSTIDPSIPAILPVTICSIVRITGVRASVIRITAIPVKLPLTLWSHVHAGKPPLLSPVERMVCVSDPPAWILFLLVGNCAGRFFHVDPLMPRDIVSLNSIIEIT